MKKFGLILLGLLIMSCGKEDLPSTNPLIGNWDIYRVDSGYSPFNPNKYYTVHERLDYTGSFEFDVDSTGLLLGSITNITEGQSKFLWDYDTTYSPIIRIPFAFLSGKTYSTIDKVNSDSLSIFFCDFVFAPGTVGARTYYHIFMTKNNTSLK